MKTLAEISPLLRSVISFWALLLCSISLYSGIFAKHHRQKKSFFFSFIPFLGSYAIWQVSHEVSLGKQFGTMGWAGDRFGSCSLTFWIAVLFGFSAILSLILYRNVIRSRTEVTSTSIKVCADRIPEGICYYRDSGRVIFANRCMNRLCRNLTGSPLLNGNQFTDACADGFLQVGEKVWNVSHRTLSYEGEPLHELVAADVTEAYEKTKQLRKENQVLSGVKKRLQDYNLVIDDVVRRQEILQAKVHIHDEMNRLMLSTVCAREEKGESLDNIIALWKNNALLLCRASADQELENFADELEKIGEALGITLKRQEYPSLTREERELVFCAAQEALANAAKHAAATELSITFTKTEEGLLCEISNNGLLPEKPVIFTGGLYNLERLCAEQGAVLSVRISQRFALELMLGKKAEEISAD